MSWGEFCTLLAGIMPKTPLGQIVSIRSEDDEEILKNFTPEQNRIRSEWRMKMMNKQHNEISQMTDEEKNTQVKKIEEMFKNAFGK